jgi:hypothetical protein
MLRQRELDELFDELEEAADGLLDATLDDERPAEPLPFADDESELAGGFRTKLAFTPRPYQDDALAAWLAADGRGSALTDGARELIRRWHLFSAGLDTWVREHFRSTFGASE